MRSKDANDFVNQKGDGGWRTRRWMLVDVVNREERQRKRSDEKGL